MVEEEEEAAAVAAEGASMPQSFLMFTTSTARPFVLIIGDEAGHSAPADTFLVCMCPSLFVSFSCVACIAS